jgi:death-on-curing protein
LNENILESAISQPAQQFGGCYLHPTLEDQMAAYLYYLSKAHAFVDGNKRTSIASAEFFLRKNGFYLDMSIDLTFEVVLMVVNDKVDREYLPEILARHIKPLSNHPHLGSRHS